MKFLLFIFLFVSLNALTLKNKNIIYLFKHKYYSYLCLHRWKYINQYRKKREDLLSLIAYSCLKKHYLTYALDVAKNLYFTSQGRINSTYIISLFTIKNYVMRYLLDKFNIFQVNIPDIESDDLGKVFSLIKKQKPIPINDKIFLKENDLNISVFFDLDTNEIIIEYFKNKKLIRKDRYW